MSRKSQTRPGLAARLGLCLALTLAACGGGDAQSGEGSELPTFDTGVLTEAPGISAQDVTGEYIADPGKGENWPSIGYSYDNRRFSPLTEINRDTVADLGLLWVSPMEAEGPQGSTPIVVDGRIYLSDSGSAVSAFEAVTGDRIWRYDPEIATAALEEVACIGEGNDGVALARGRLFVGQLDGRLTALDASTGAVLWSNRTSGDQRRAIVGAPLVVGNHVIVGNAGACPAGEGNARAQPVGRGYVSAYVMQDGQLDWRFHTVPTRVQVLQALGGAGGGFLADAARSWPLVQDGANPGGGFVPRNIAYDAAEGDLLFGTDMRLAEPGDGASGRGLFASSLIALDPESGRYRWHRQLAPGGTGWSANAPIVFAPLPERAAEPGDSGDSDEPDSASDAVASDTAPGAGHRAAWLPLENGWLVALRQKASFLAYAAKYGGGRSPIAGYDDLGAPGRPSADAPRRAEAIHWGLLPTSYSEQTGQFLLHRSRIPASQDGKEKGEPQSLIAFDPKTGKPAWTTEEAGPAPLATAGGLIFARYRAPFASGLGILDAKDGRLIYFRADILPTGGMATFMAGGRQMVAFPAMVDGKPQIAVMGLGGRLRPGQGDAQ